MRRFALAPVSRHSRRSASLGSFAAFLPEAGARAGRREPRVPHPHGGNGVHLRATTSGDAYCWGDNAQGQLGDGTTTPSAAPILVSGGLSFSRLWAGNDHTCGRTTTQDAYCWGSAEAVGSPVDQMSTVPVRVLGQP